MKNFMIYRISKIESLNTRVKCNWDMVKITLKNSVINKMI